MKASWDKIKHFLKKTKDIQHIGIANIAAKAIAGLFWLYMATVLGTEDYGQVTYFIAIGSMAAAISLIGSTNTLIVYTAKRVPLQPAIYFITLILGTISSLVIFLIFQNWAVSLFAIGFVVFNLGISYLLGKKYYKKYSIYFVLQKILFVSFALIFYFIMGYVGIILGYALSFLVFSHIIIRGFNEIPLDFSVLKKRFGFMMNNYALTLEYVIKGQLDKIIIAPLFGFSLLGNFALGAQIMSITYLIPTIVYQYTLSQDATGNPTYKIKKLSILSSIGSAGLVFLLSPILIPLVFPEFVEMVQVVQILSIVIIPSAISMSYISKFLGIEKSRIVLTAQAIHLFVYIPGIFILGQFYGINGVAYSLVSAGIIQTIFYVIANRYLINSKFFEKSNRYF